jgi:hypothetical protein
MEVLYPRYLQLSHGRAALQRLNRIGLSRVLLARKGATGSLSFMSSMHLLKQLHHALQVCPPPPSRVDLV